MLHQSSTTILNSALVFAVSLIYTSIWFTTPVDARTISRNAVIDRKARHQEFSLETVYLANKTRNFPLAMKNAYGRYGITPTLFNPTLSRAANYKSQDLPKWALEEATKASDYKGSSVMVRRKDGTVVSTPQGGDAEYISTISIGGQKVRLALDTGSADLWCFADTMPSAYPGHKSYSSSKSTTYQPMTGSSWYITYADGTYAGGTVGTDTVKAGSVSVKNVPFGMAESVSDGYINDIHVDGVMGLSFSTINTVRPDQQLTFFESAIPTLKKGLFTVTLKHQASGSYDFGYIDAKKYKGSVKYVKVFQDSGYWQVWNTAWQVGTDPKVTEAGTYGVLDTGTSLLLLSDAACAAYWAKVDGAHLDDSSGSYIFPCASTLPDFSIMVGSGSSKLWLKIPGALMNYGYITSDGLTCYGGLQSRGSSDLNIIGDIMFKAFFVVFDKAKSRAGFAAQA